MEVHAHNHSPRKKWFHYLWEFFMLFLAVTLGFFVENQREHLSESRKAKEYVRAVVDDLKSDTAWINGFLNDSRIAINDFDSTIILLSKRERTATEQRRLYVLVRTAIRYSDFYKSNDNAYEQLKNSGNVRLLPQNVADSISKYYFNAKEAVDYTDQALLREEALLEYEGKIFDGNVFQEMIDKETFNINIPLEVPSLMTSDKNTINEFIVRVHYVVSIIVFARNAAIRQIPTAVKLMEFLNKEYHLQ